jgi:hypothetical protein
MSLDPDRFPELMEGPRRRPTEGLDRGLLGLISERLRGRPLSSRKPLASPRPVPPRGRTGHTRFRLLLTALRLLPWVLGALFAASLIWDFEGMKVELVGRSIGLEGLLRTISIGGLIGFFTNWLAIQMLFHPREPRPLLGHGLVPAQRDRIIERLARTISEELINEEMLKRQIEQSGVISHYRDASAELVRELIEDPTFREELKRITTRHVEGILDDPAVRERIVSVIAERIQDRAGRGVAGWLVRLYRTLDEDTYRAQIERAVRELPAALDPILDHLDERLDSLPDSIERHAHQIEDLATRAVLGFVEQLDVYGMLVDNMTSYDESRLERMLKTTADEQLRFIKYIGAVLGCVGGLVIWKPGLALGVLAVLGGVVFTVDVAWHRYRNRASSARR